MPAFKPKEVIRILEKLGFIRKRQTGSHVIMQNPRLKKQFCPNACQRYKKRFNAWHYQTSGVYKRIPQIKEVIQYFYG